MCAFRHTFCHRIDRNPLILPVLIKFCKLRSPETEMFSVGLPKDPAGKSTDVSLQRI